GGWLRPLGRRRVGAAWQINRRGQDHLALPTRSLRDHPPHEGEGKKLTYSGAPPSGSLARLGRSARLDSATRSTARMTRSRFSPEILRISASLQPRRISSASRRG